MLRQGCIFVRAAKARWERPLLAERNARGFRQIAQQWSIENTGSNGHHANAIAGQVSRYWQSHANNTPLGGRVRCLPDLAVKGRDGSGIDNYTAFTTFVRRILRHCRRCQSDGIKRTYQVDVDDSGESGKAGWPALAQDSFSNSDSRAVDQDMQTTKFIDRCPYCGLHRFFIRDVCLHK